MRTVLSSRLAALLAYVFIISCGGDYPADISITLKNSIIPVRQGGHGSIELQIRIPKGAYIYGNPKGPGTGKPTVVLIPGAKMFDFEKPRYKKPEKYRPAGEKDFVWIYEKETGILVPFGVPVPVRPADYTITATVEALLCSKSACIPKRLDIPVTIRVYPADAPGYTPGETAPPEGYTYFPDDRSPGTSVMPGSSPAIKAGSPVYTPRYISSTRVHSILQAILFGILAGFILNFMPCVLPVVSLKIMSFVRYAGQDRKKTAIMGLLFSLGILTSFAVLALLAAFLGYNWGELFQKRLFLISMIAVTYALSLSMFGVYTLNMPSFVGKAAKNRENPYLDSYLKGLLATLLATPCSGPFLGGTLAWAFTQPPHVIIIIFMSIGTGMALPYLVLSINNKFMRFIPKPGAWTFAFEDIMGFLLAGTAVYLIGIMGEDHIMPLLWFLMCITLGLWIYGKYGSMERPARSRRLSFLALIIITVAGYWVSFEYLYGAKQAVQRMRWEEFSLAEIYRNRDAGTLSMVRFTADWCPNCTLVEKTALDTMAVADAVRNRNVRIYTADITRENPEAQGLLSELGSRSIPFLAVFPSGRAFTSPLCLRDIYSKEDVVEAIEKAASP